MIKVLMCGSKLTVKGGMTSVIKNYVGYKEWGEYEIEFLPTHVEGGRLKKSTYFLFAYIRIFFKLLFSRIELVHLHVSERGSFWRKEKIVKLAKRFKKRVILHHHGAEFEEFYESCSEQQKKNVARILGLADLNIVLSKRLVEPMKEKNRSARVEYLYNSVTVPEKNTYSSENVNILFLGRLGKRKGVYDLLPVIKNLDNKIENKYKFFLCGDGEVAEVIEKVKGVEIEHRIGHIGWVSGEERDEILSGTVINVLPSYNEGLPMTILETMARGIPNISTYVASIPEVIENEVNGFLIEPGDMAALEADLIKLIGDKELREEFSEKSYELIKNNFSLDEHIKLLKDLYKDC